MGQGKDQVKVFGRQNLASSFFKPAFPRHVLARGAMPIAAGMIQNPQGAAVAAPIDMAAKIRGAAV